MSYQKSNNIIEKHLNIFIIIKRCSLIIFIDSKCCISFCHVNVFGFSSSQIYFPFKTVDTINSILQCFEGAICHYYMIMSKIFHYTFNGKNKHLSIDFYLLTYNYQCM